MKNISKYFFRSYNAVLAAMIAVLGFSASCETRAEYGVPSAKFIVNGNVQSELLNTPIKSIRVVMQRDTAFTDESGNFTVVDEFGFPTSQTFDIKFQDVDSSLNGQFENKDTTVSFVNPKFSKGNGHWYQGETSIEFNVKLKPGQ